MPITPFHMGPGLLLDAITHGLLHAGRVLSAGLAVLLMGAAFVLRRGPVS